MGSNSLTPRKSGFNWAIIARYAALRAGDSSGKMAVWLFLPSAKCPMFHCTTLKRTGDWFVQLSTFCSAAAHAGDAAAQSKGDVQFAATKAELEQKIEEFKARGITEYTVSAHVPGDLVKFYGVAGTGFFRYYYPTDDGDTKFGDEQRNGAARHYPFMIETLQGCAEQLAKAVGISVYGGDCIVDEKGAYSIIDFNDWPSFSRCREEASEAIASLI